MILAKPLTLSDITLVREFVTPTRKQQAVVLPKKFLRSLGFEYSEYERGFEIPLNLTICGPGSEPDIGKPGARISRHPNDWRLDRCVIRQEEYSTGRFSSVKEGDVLLLSVELDTGAGIAIFLSGDSPDDTLLVNALDSLVGQKAGFSRKELIKALENSSVGQDHAVWSIIEQKSDSDITLAGGLAAKGAGYCSPSELKKRLEDAERIGLEGEKLFDRWLKIKPVLFGKKVEDYLWVSQENAVSPYDFVAKLEDGRRVFIEVKTTTKDFSADFYVSAGELAEMGTNEVVLARIYNLDSGPALRVCENTQAIAVEIMSGVELIEGARAVTFSVSPGLFEFQVEIPLSGELQGQLF